MICWPVSTMPVPIGGGRIRTCDLCGRRVQIHSVDEVRAMREGATIECMRCWASRDCRGRVDIPSPREHLESTVRSVGRKALEEARKRLRARGTPRNGRSARIPPFSPGTPPPEAESAD